MVRKFVNIEPLDFKKDIAIGISIPFNGDAVFNSTYTTKDQIRSNIINFFLTNKNERVFNPSFGGNLRELLFEQITNSNLNNLKDIVESSLTKYFPQINVEELVVLGNDNTINITLSYKINNTNINDKFVLEIAN